MSEFAAYIKRAARQAAVAVIGESDTTTRWLSPKALGRYLGRDPKTLPELVRVGKLPRPTYHLGPKSPRYDRVAVDSMLIGRSEEADAEEIASRAIRQMRAEYESRPTRTRRRNRTGI
jgi:hypothetical protein